MEKDYILVMVNGFRLLVQALVEMPIAKEICFDASDNRDYKGENIMRARAWNDVYSLVK